MSSSSSKQLILILVVVAVVLAIPIFLFARRSRPEDSADKVTRVAYASMKSDLQGLLMAEEATRRLKGRYEVDPEQAGHLSSPGVTPPIIILSDTGWSATVGFKTIPEIKCAVAVHNRNPLKRFAKSGEIVCE